MTKVHAREVARLLTLDNPKVRERLLKECDNGTIPTALFIELLHYGFGLPRQRIEVEPGQGLLTFMTRRPLGYDPLRPDEPLRKVIEAKYGRLGGGDAQPDGRPHGASSGDGPEGSTPPAPSMAKASIVPSPDLADHVKPHPPAARKRMPQPNTEGDEMTILRVDGL